jgi:hypothetical protein
MLLMAALAACGGGDAPDGSRDAAPATEPGATEEAEPEPAGSGASGRSGSQATGTTEAEDSPKDSGGILSGLRGASGRGESGQAAFSFSTVTGGYGASCAVKTNGSLLCWGRSSHDSVIPPDGTFESVSSSRNYTCGVTTNKSLICWAGGGRHTIPGSYESVSAAVYLICALRTDGSAFCDHEMEPPADSGPFLSAPPVSEAATPAG